MLTRVEMLVFGLLLSLTSISAACAEEKPRTPGSWLRLCPDCGQPLQIEGGDELDILRVSFVSYDAGGGAGT